MPQQESGVHLQHLHGCFFNWHDAATTGNARKLASSVRMTKARVMVLDAKARSPRHPGQTKAARRSLLSSSGGQLQYLKLIETSYTETTVQVQAPANSPKMFFRVELNR